VIVAPDRTSVAAVVRVHPPLSSRARPSPRRFAAAIGVLITTPKPWRWSWIVRPAIS
jgi:hypothetical protein